MSPHVGHFFLGTAVPPPPSPFAYWVSSLCLDLYPSDSVCGLYYYPIQPTYAIRCMGTNPCIPDLPPIREAAKVQSGYAQLAPSTFSRVPYKFNQTLSLRILVTALRHACICSARMRNLDGYVTGHPLRNRSSGYITGRPDALPMYNASRLRNRLARCITSVFGYVTGRPVAEPYT